MPRHLPAILLLSLLTVPQAARAELAASEVLVVANARSDESVALAREYLAAREIPAANLLLVRTSQEYRISRRRYNAEIAAPVRERLREAPPDRPIRCIGLVWGVPVRVGSAVVGDSGKIQAVYERARTRAHHRLAIDYELLGTVGKTFPAPRTAGLQPLGRLFDAMTGALPEELDPAATLQMGLRSLLKTVAGEVARIDHEPHRRIADRQLMGLWLDAFGLEGLIEHVRRADPLGAPDVAALDSRLTEARGRLATARTLDPSPETAELVLALEDAIGGAWQVYRHTERELESRRESDAAVDSELALVLREGRVLAGPAPNPLRRSPVWAPTPDESPGGPPALMTARIDGPTPADARRIIHNSLAAEAKGLEGTFYIDAGGLHPHYDRNFRVLHDLVATHTEVPSVLDEDRKVFAPGRCPGAALYVGWYSLGQYVPAFEWVPGAVGWHVASFEAMHLRDPDSNEWCVKMLQNGVAATVGAVAEPRLGAFPLPQEFFALLLTGEFTVAECYWRTAPTASWRMTLIADPLYNPFARTPQLSVRDLPGLLAE